MYPGHRANPGIIFAALALVRLIQTVDGHTLLIAPNGGETLIAGDSFTIEWIVEVAHNLEDWDLWYSVNSADGPGIEIAIDLPAGDPSQGSQHFFDWTTPSTNADQAWVRVHMDNAGEDYDDVSDLPFTIQALTVSCDFNDDGTCHLDDLNALLAEGPVASGVPVVSGTNDQFDLDGDGTLDLEDVDQWLAGAAAENGFSAPYRRGDADLNGYVAGQDFLAWNACKFTNVLRWDHGDFNGDAGVDGSDFLLWNSSKFQASAASVVPEPRGLAAVIVTLFLNGFCFARRS